jgi:uncharacterized protein
MTRTYPNGVTSWIDLAHPDLGAAQDFYGELLGWTFETATPPDAPAPYVIARLAGEDAAGLTTGGSGTWRTYVAVDDADATAAAIGAAGGRIDAEPTTGQAGRSAYATDPTGAAFGLWQPGYRLGVQIANVPGAWNFSDLHTGDPDAAIGFYESVFGWVFDDLGFATMIRVRGYGDHLAATSDPDIHQRQASAPPGFADVIGGLAALQPGEPPHWHVSFTVADRDAAAKTAERLGGTVESTAESQWTRTAVIRDPQGATFTASQFTPPDPG